MTMSGPILMLDDSDGNSDDGLSEPLSLRERIKLLAKKPKLSNFVFDTHDYVSEELSDFTKDSSSLSVKKWDDSQKSNQYLKIAHDRHVIVNDEPPLQNVCAKVKDNELEFSDTDSDENMTLSSCVQSKLKRSSESSFTKITISNQNSAHEIDGIRLAKDKNSDADDYNRNRTVEPEGMPEWKQNRQSPKKKKEDNITDTKLTKKEEMQERKAAREKERLEKNAAKEQEKLRKKEERDMKKEQQEKEKASKKAERLTVRTDSRDQCLKHMITVLDPILVNDGGGAILKALEGLGVQYEVKALPVASSVGWMREKIEFNVSEGAQINRASEYVEENHMLIRIKADEFARMIEAQKQHGKFSIESHSEGILQYIDRAETLLPDKKMSMAVIGMDAYSKKAKAKQKPQSSKKSKNQEMPFISKIDLEEILLGLQLRSNCVVHFCETAEDLAEMVAMTTKAVAEAPYKKNKNTCLNLFVEHSEKGLSRVTKDGIGLGEVWTKQIQQFNGVVHDTAASIVREYPSPYSLIQAYRGCPSERSAELLLQDIEVRRGHGVLATVRRIGPALSNKIYRLLTLKNPHEELAKS